MVQRAEAQTPGILQLLWGEWQLREPAAILPGSYADSTEMEFELPPRNFNSFSEAAREAAISRFYGGIHYMPSIENGIAEGERIGSFITKKLITVK